MRANRIILRPYKARLCRAKKTKRLFRVRARKGAEMAGGLEPVCLGDQVHTKRFKEPGCFCWSGSDSPRTEG